MESIYDTGFWSICHGYYTLFVGEVEGCHHVKLGVSLRVLPYLNLTGKCFNRDIVCDKIGIEFVMFVCF